MPGMNQGDSQLLDPQSIRNGTKKSAKLSPTNEPGPHTKELGKRKSWKLDENCVRLAYGGRKPQPGKCLTIRYVQARQGCGGGLSVEFVGVTYFRSPMMGRWGKVCVEGETGPVIISLSLCRDGS